GSKSVLPCTTSVNPCGARRWPWPCPRDPPRANLRNPAGSFAVDYLLVRCANRKRCGPVQEGLTSPSKGTEPRVSRIIWEIPANNYRRRAKHLLVGPEFGRRSTGLRRSAIMKPLPKWGMVLITAASLALYTGLAVWGWGGWSAFMAHPARAGA